MKISQHKMWAWVLAVILLVSTVSVSLADATVDVIMNAKTTQAFTQDTVPAADVETILKAGLAATSAINQQPWFFVAVSNPEILAKLSSAGAMPTGAFPTGAIPEGAPAGATAPEGAPAGVTPPEGASAPADAPANMPAMPASNGPKAAMGDSPLAIIIYQNPNSKSPDASFDCGLATQNMVIAANALGYGTKIISSPTMTLNGSEHDSYCELLGVDPSLQAVAVLLVGRTAADTDGATGASVRDNFETKTVIIP